MNVDVDGLRAAAELLPDDAFEHKGDCGGSMCAGCGHCCHSIAKCDHECDPGGGCSTAIDTDELRFRRDVVAALDRLQAAEAAVERVRDELGDESMRCGRFGLPCHVAIAESKRWCRGCRLSRALDGPQEAIGADLSASGAESDHGDRREGEGLA